LLRQADRDAHGLPTSLSDLRNHRIVKQHGVQFDKTGYAKSGVRLAGRKRRHVDKFSVAVHRAIERGVGIGSIALGANIVTIDLGIDCRLSIVA
jgi:hypothetical protein